MMRIPATLLCCLALAACAAPPRTGEDVDVDAVVVAEDTGGFFGWLTGRRGGPAREEGKLYVSRLFASGGSLPPEGFLGYAVLAFPDRPVDKADYDRFEMICRAFRGSLSSVAEVKDYGEGKADEDKQVVTVLPVESQKIADQIEAMPSYANAEACALAARHYGLQAAQDAVSDAQLAAGRAGFDWIDLDRGRGPFLLAWNPGAGKGHRDVLVLAADLSNTSTYAQARTDFRHWQAEVEKRPELWLQGPWNVELARREAQRWLDRRIGLALGFLGSSDDAG
ncbi:hypothetical protein [Oceanicola sp. S124]|uniref:hypothetical protein n=1 Tax=Oceanicola sp. S124 TaxID=1042378 RepID=UPI0002557977|nr:hypothetical protein [Oceanicola sp. S124]